MEDRWKKRAAASLICGKAVLSGAVVLGLAVIIALGIYIAKGGRKDTDYRSKRG